LYSYVSLNSPKVKPILLIDEAETHLHYDAQADLVRVFETQTDAAQIIYTTHSAACLPSDLGTGIRVVGPSDATAGLSIINNSFWVDGPGLSPLLMAMGASVMAIIPTRRAIMAEGASDVILLPTLLRAATGQRQLRFQIAPGIARVSESEARELELEAPVVAYLVDGDRGGSEHRRKLVRAGIEARRIVQLPGGKVAEDFVKDRFYVLAVNEELKRSHGAGVEMPIGALTKTQRPSAVAAWCRRERVRPPSKVRVACRLAELMRHEDGIVSKRAKEDLLKVFGQIQEALGLL
jgi:predicted ATP-dependent endonuclease of OLD family